MNPEKIFGVIGGLAGIALFVIIVFFPEQVVNPRVKQRAEQLNIYKYDTKTGEQVTPDSVKLSKADFNFLMTGKR